KPGDTVKAEDSLVTLESDKATMDVPAPAAGVIKSLGVKVGDKVSEGHLILTLEEAAGAAAPAQAAPASKAAQPAAPARAPAAPAPAAPPTKPPTAAPAAPIAPAPPMHATAPSAPIDDAAFRKAHASPSVRAHARALGVDLSQIQGSGPAGRILQEDVENYVKQVMSGAKVAGAVAGAGGAALGLLPWPQVDFAKFGPIETKPLSRIKKIAGANLHRNWVLIPHVTNHDDADITELEAFRVQLNKENEKAGIKVTLLAFLIKACVWALKKFPEFNASLDGENLVLKQYYHIGFAADTPNGLVVPVIRNADQKGVLAIAGEMGELSAKAREGKLPHFSGDRQRNGGAFGEGARRQARSGRHAGRMFFDLQPGRDRRNVLHAYHQRTRGRDPRRVPVEHAARLGRQAIRPEADTAAVAFLGPSRDRRGGGRPFQQLSRLAARRHAAHDA